MGSPWKPLLLLSVISGLSDFAVAVRPVSYAAVLRMKPDISSSLLSSWPRPRHRYDHGRGLVTPDWPASFSNHHLSTLSLLSSQEEYRSQEREELGPVFVQEPHDAIFALDSEEKKVMMSCEARGNPAPVYSWFINGTAVDVEADYRYSLIDGNLIIANASETADYGRYQCKVENSYGTVLSRDALLQFAYLGSFSGRTRGGVSVREGQGVVLMCTPPPHSPGLMGEYEPKIEVHFPLSVPAARGVTVRLECFALGNPVPTITWRKMNGNIPKKARLRKSQAVLEIPNVQLEDSGTYECKAENPRGGTAFKGHLQVYTFPQWISTINDSQLDSGDQLHWECKATGKPRPTYRWLRNGEPFTPQGTLDPPTAGSAMESRSHHRYSHHRYSHTGNPRPTYRWLRNGEPFTPQSRVEMVNGELIIQTVQQADSGMYQCVAENKYGAIYCSAELNILASPPVFSPNPVRLIATLGKDMLLGCRPRASPKPRVTWRRGDRRIQPSRR
ncbi:contactin-5-like [Salvelinus alpinus]